MLWTALAAIALIAFAIEGAIGFGGTVVAVTLGAQLVALGVLLPAFVPVNLVLSGWLLVRGRRAIAWRLLALELAPPLAAGAALGMAAFHLPGSRWLVLAFAVFVIALAALELVRPARRDLPCAARGVMLVLGGVAHGLFGTGGPLVVYVTRRRLADPRAFRATLAVVWLVLNTALLVHFAVIGAYTVHVARALAAIGLAIVPAIALGERLHRRLDAARFERAVWLLLLVAGIALGVRA